MWWLWFAGPVALVVVYFLTGRSRKIEQRRERDGKSWRVNEGAGARSVGKPPGDLGVALQETVGGRVFSAYELYPKLAYVALASAEPTELSDHQTVVAKLAKPGPSLTVSPISILDGTPQPNRGIPFTKHAAFMAEYVTTAEDDKEQAAVKRWLSRPIRKALLEYPGLWLRVRGDVMTVTLYGSADAAQIDELIVSADAIFAEVGGGDAPSLLGPDEDDEPAPAGDAAPATS